MQKENYAFAKQMQCANQHICAAARDCAFCQVNFKYVAENPYELECDHVQCDKCREKKKYNAMVCKQHGLVKIFQRSKLNELIPARISELFQFLSDEYKAIWEFYNSNSSFS